MAIYKLKDVGKWSCNKFISSNFFVSTDNMKGSEILKQKYGVGKEFRVGGILLSNIRPYFKKVWFATCDGAHSGDVLNFIVNQNIVLEKYIFFILSSKNFNVFWNRTSKGTKMPRGDKNSMLNYKINIPSINEQQKIIDIIEPFEKIIETINNAFLIIKKLENILLINNATIEKMNTNCSFIKGKSPNEEGDTLFLNVAAANKKKNRFVSNKPNTFVGDVTLSLDGNTGLVNNSLEGYNGYLYKVESEIYDNSQIFYSLLTGTNQRIIKMNETGTTIKHALNAKKDLLIFEFKDKMFLKNLFNLRIKLKQNIYRANLIKGEIIKLLIK